MDIFDIVQNGTYNDFIENYNGDIKQIDKYIGDLKKYV